MSDPIQQELDRLTAAAAGLEAQRSLLGDAILQPALDSLYEKIAALQAQRRADPGAHPLNSAPEAVSEERRIVTILFSDVVGSTALASQYDPEEWHEILAAVHALAGGIIHQHQGMVLQYLGDGLLALFGAQAAGERDAEQALRAALAIQAALPGLASQRSLPLQDTLQMRIGIHTGLVLLGEIRSSTRTEPSASGDAMNVAARLQSAAPPGGILISHDTYRYVRETFDVQPQPPLLVKGKQESLRTYLVLAARPARFRNVMRGVAGMQSPTVGRRVELDRLKSAYLETLQRKSTRWLHITGEPGIGKSRLLGEMRNFFPQRTPNYHLLKARTYPEGEREAYAVVCRMWMDYFHIPEDAPAQEIETRWLVSIAQTSSNLDEAQLHEAARALGYLIGLPFSHPHPAPARADELKNQAMQLSRLLLTCLRQSAPVVMLLEDVHWLDQSSWDYFIQAFKVSMEMDQDESSAKNLSGPLFILSAARPECSLEPALTSSPAYSAVELAPLTPDDCASLTRFLLKDVVGVPETVIQRMIERAEGIPYFVEEMVNWFFDLGVIDQSVKPWQYVGEKFQPALLPGTLQHLLLSRLDHLQPQDKKLLQVGSVLGRRFWEGWLDAQGQPGCHDRLSKLQPHSFVVQQAETAFEGQAEWRFYHQMQQEVTYGSLLKRQRKELHRAAAEWLETLAGRLERVDEYAGSIGEHARQAGELVKACAWFQRAGSYAHGRGALAEARLYYEHALQLLPADDLEARWRLLLLHDEVIGLLSDTPARLAEDEELVALARQLGGDDRLAEAYARQGNYFSYCGNHQRAAPLLQKAYLSALNAQNLAIASQALGMYVIALVALGRLDEADQSASQVLELANQSGDKLTLAMGLTNLSTYYAMLGDHYQASRLINQQVLLTRTMKHRMGELRGLNNLGYEYILLGMFPIGIVILEKACELAEAYGIPRDAAYARLNLGLGHLRLGDFDSAHQTLEHALRSLSVASDQYGLLVGQVYLGLAHERHGELTAAQKLFEQAHESSQALNLPGNAMDSLAGLARCRLLLGDLPQAQSHNVMLWKTLQESHAAGMEFPVLAYQTCAMVFEASVQPDLAARAVLAGTELLMANAERISDPNWREVYLHEITENKWMQEKAHLFDRNGDQAQIPA